MKILTAFYLITPLLLGAHASSQGQSFFSMPKPPPLSPIGTTKPTRPAPNADANTQQLIPLTSLSHLSPNTFTALAHPAFPGYGVRIKKADGFCDPSVNAYTGYIDIRAHHLFFYFFESRSDPATDDVVFWTNGGPGCSSSLGLLMELGPCRMNASSPSGVTPHPESWNSAANVFFVDQPVGVGYSYAEFGESVGTTEEAAKDIAAFVAIFFAHFTQFQGRAFHMAGESYGGRYIPVFAAEVYDQNAKLVEMGMEPINLTSIMIGNGITDFNTVIPSYFDMACSGASVPPIYDISSCVRMKQTIPRCQKWVKGNCVDQFDSIGCMAAMTFCSSELIEPFFSTNKNPYDISKDCDGGFSETLCYPITKNISAYLSLPSTHHLLGVDPSLANTTFSSCSDTVDAAFAANMDGYHSTYLYVAALLEHGVRALIYAGSYDWICNWVGNEAWTRALEWSGQAEFGEGELAAWEVDGKRAGVTRSGKGLTFATIEGAGHMVPYDKPKESLELVKRWLAGEEL